MAKADFKLSLWNWVVIFCKGKFGGGLTSAFSYIANLLNDKVLSRVAPEELKKYSELVVALAEFGEKILNIYCMDYGKRRALAITVENLRRLADSLGDGKVTPEELEEAVNSVVEVIHAWKDIHTIEVAEKPKQVEEPSEIDEQFVPGEPSEDKD